MHGQLKLRFLFSMEFVLKDGSLKYFSLGFGIALDKIYFR